MPDGFPPPTPAPAREPIEATGGFSFNSSSALIVDASADGALSGPWFIREQRLDAYYTRVAFKGADSSEPSSFSLSAQSQSHLVGSTDLKCLIYYSVNKRVDYNYYATTSFWQPQKFTLYQYITDANGNKYNDPVGYQFGPEGKVLTSQVGMSRVLYDATNPDHVVEFSSAYSNNFAACNWDVNKWIWDNAGCEQAGGISTWSKAMHSAWEHPQGPHSYKVGDSPGLDGVSFREWVPIYPIVGGYQTDVEWSGVSTIQNVMDWIGQNIKEGPGPFGVSYSPFFKRASAMGSSANGKSTLPSANSPDYPDYHHLANWDYDWTWHDWT